MKEWTLISQSILKRLKLGLFERDLAHRFKVSESSVSVIVRTWLRFLRSEFEPLIKLPPRDVIRFHSSKSFKTLFTNVVVIVDCTEVEMEKPSALNSNSACYSSYKSRPTMKSLLTQTFASSEAKKTRHARILIVMLTWAVRMRGPYREKLHRATANQGARFLGIPDRKKLNRVFSFRPLYHLFRA